MRRREFIAGLGSAAAWPLIARAQQPDRLRRIGVPDFTDIFRRSASYVDRILRGDAPADLPVQFPTKFDLVI